MKSRKHLTALLVGWLATTGAVLANDGHYQLDVTAKLNADAQQNLNSVEISWVYDKTVSDIYLDGADLSPGNAKATLDKLGNDIVSELFVLGYYTHLSANGLPVAFQKARQPSLTLTEDKRMVLAFELPLQQPLPAKQPWELTIFDPDAGANMVFTPTDPVKLDTALASQCQKPTIRSEKQRINEHDLTVQTAVIRCP